MKIKALFVVVITALVILGSFFALSYGLSNHSISSSKVFSTATSTTWNGFLTIYRNGSLSDPSAPVGHTGSYYNLTGNISGGVTIENPGAIFNGNGFIISGVSGGTPLLINGADNVTFESTVLYGSTAPVLKTYLSSNDLIWNNTIFGVNSGISINSPNTIVTGNTVNMTLTSPGFSGVPVAIVTGASNTTITYNTVYVPIKSQGILINSKSCNIIGNSVNITGTGSTGIEALNGNNLISSNKVLVRGDSSFDIMLTYGSQSNNLSQNKLSMAGNSSSGVSVSDGYNQLELNTIIVTGNSSYAINIPYSGTGTISISENLLNITGQSSKGIYSNAGNTLVTDNKIVVRGDNSYGINSLKKSTFTANNISVVGSSSYGIYTLLNDLLISENSILVQGDNDVGLLASSASYLTVKSNTIVAMDNNTTGIWFGGSHSELSLNLVTSGMKNGTALVLHQDSMDVVSNNTLYNSSVLLSSSYSTNDLFVGNNFSNSKNAFVISGAGNDKFYHNSFVNYTSYSIAFSTSLTWDNGYPSGGNFWSTYVGKDLFSGPGQNVSGPDGIGDKQFNITPLYVDHYPLMKSWSRPMVIFTEVGLALGTPWSVSFNSSEATSSTNTISFGIPDAANATYTYTVASVSGYLFQVSKGSVIYTGSNIFVTITFTPIVPPPPPPPSSYSVHFSESGLPQGTAWSVTFNGSKLSSTTAQIEFSAHNGSYSYNVESVGGYSLSKSIGTIIVNGQNVSVSVQFSRVSYVATFHTVGLPSGITWYLNFSNGQSYSSNGSSISVNVANGTYTYTISNVSGYNVSRNHGSLSVNGQNPGAVFVTYTKQTPIVPPIHFDFWIYIVIGIVIGAGVVATILTVYYRRR